MYVSRCFHTDQRQLAARVNDVILPCDLVQGGQSRKHDTAL